MRLVQRIRNGFRHLAATGITHVHKEQTSGLRTLVPAVLARAHIEHFSADILGLIGHTFKMADDHHQRVQRLERDLAFAAQFHEIPIETVFEYIHGFFDLHRFSREFGVLLNEGLNRVA